MSVINFFAKFDHHHTGARGLEVIDIAQEDLSVWLVTRKEMFHDYQVFRQIRDFLESNKVRVPEQGGGGKIANGHGNIGNLAKKRA